MTARPLVGNVRKKLRVLENLKALANRPAIVIIPNHWTGDRVAEGAALEMLCTACPYRGFESHPVRHRKRDFIIALFCFPTIHPLPPSPVADTIR